MGRTVQVLKSCRLRWRLGQLLKITYTNGRVTWGVTDDFGIALYGADERRAREDFAGLVPNCATYSVVKAA